MQTVGRKPLERSKSFDSSMVQQFHPEGKHSLGSAVPSTSFTPLKKEITATLRKQRSLSALDSRDSSTVNSSTYKYLLNII